MTGSAFARRVEPATWLLVPALVVSLLLVSVGAGLAAPMLPIVGVAAMMLLLGLPMRWPVLLFLATALLVDNPAERPMNDLWRSPILPLGELLYLNLHKHTGIAAFRFSLLELLVGLLMFVVVWRKLRHDSLDDPARLGALANPMKLAFAAMFGAVLFLEVYGLARGGDFKNSLWQLRQLVWLPVLGILFGNSLKTPSSRRWLVRIILAVACARALLGIYFYIAIARPTGVRPEYVTTHSDAVLAVLAMLLAAMTLVAHPSRDHFLLNLVVQPVVLVGLVLNDRRIAFVSLAAGFLTLVLLAPAELRRRVQRAVIAAIPLVLVYMVVGWHSNATVFRPVSIVRSVTAQEDASSQTRDIENYNLIRTLKRRPLLGSGFGHEYEEQVQANRVDQFFAQYRFIAHNSVLWLLSLSGLVGFALVWAVFPTAVLVSLAVLRTATSPGDRITAFGGIVAVLCYVVQGWGDMGLQSWMATLLVAALTGATGAIYTQQRLDEEHPA